MSAIDKIFGLFEEVDKAFGLTPAEEREIRDAVEQGAQTSTQEVLRQAPELREQDGLVTPSVIRDKAEEAGSRTDVVGVMAAKIPAFSSCNDWKDIARVIGREGFKIYKEMFFIQVFAGGICLVVIDNVTPVGKFVVGPILVKIGYENSSFLRRFAPKSAVDQMTKVDIGKAKGRASTIPNDNSGKKPS